ncbi:MAG: hypothetical protein ACI4W2_01905 [Eubacterium sp.]
MSDVRRKPARAVLCLVLAFVVAFTFLLATSAVFAAASAGSDQKITGTFKTKGILLDRRLTGEMHIDKSAFTYDKNRNEVVFNADTTDLFNEACDEYVKYYEHDLFANKYKHLVMSSKGLDGKEAYPYFTYTVTFPENVKVNHRAVIMSADTSTIGGMTCDNVNDHTLKFTFKLGGWWDYGEFFDHVQQEAADGKAHPIQVTIPVSGTIKGQVTGTGLCELYKFGKHPKDDPVVKITAPEQQLF